jgi:AraC-like DNA-binding protein
MMMMPNDISAAADRNPHAALMQAMAAFIDAHVDEALPLARLAQEAGMSAFHF